MRWSASGFWEEMKIEIDTVSWFRRIAILRTLVLTDAFPVLLLSIGIAQNRSNQDPYVVEIQAVTDQRIALIGDFFLGQNAKTSDKHSPEEYKLSLIYDSVHCT
jgi:hypothetical protein